MARTLPGLGLPVGAIIQYAYTVPDIETAMRHYVDVLGVGPWYRMGPFTPPAARYRGEPHTPTLSLARAFVGDSMIELIEQHDDGPSIYREVIDQAGYGFHHWAITSDDVDADLARFDALGFPVVFEDRLPSGARIVYVDPKRDLPGFLEIIELNESQDEKFAGFHQASVDWDGTDPFRVG